jgi:nitrogen fixation protein NifB
MRYPFKGRTFLCTVILNHPCFEEKAHFVYGRIHLPVARHCNMKCRYCSREIGISYHSYRPAVAREVITPEEAVSQVFRHLDDTLKVVGIAGPGEPLYNESTFETLGLVHEMFPDLMLCVATNGLLLPEKVEILSDLGVKTVTVTVNTVIPETVPKIYAHIQGKMSQEVAETFIEAQLQGIEQCTQHDMVVKINSILIPGINMTEMEEVALQTRERGAYIQNITSLIPLAEFSELEPPSCGELQAVRKTCERILPQFRLCKQCRADSVGIPGKGDLDY